MGAPSTQLVHAKGSALLPLEQARVLLAQCRQVDEVVELRDRAEAVRVYLSRRDTASEAHADAGEIVQQANRRLGELLRELPQHPTGGGRPKRGNDETSNAELQVSKSDQLRDLGITRMQCSRLEKLAEIPEDEFRTRLEHQRAKTTKSLDPSVMTAATASSEHDGDAWGTPPKYSDAARTVLGGIALDPATNERAQQVIRAERYFTRESNGLSQEWKAPTLWINPPFSDPLVAQFCNRFCDEYEAGHFSAGIVLVNACIETRWFQRMIGVCTAVCFPSERIAFLDANGNPVKGNAYRQALLYAGPKLPLFAKVFRPIGRVLVEYAGTGVCQ